MCFPGSTPACLLHPPRVLTLQRSRSLLASVIWYTETPVTSLGDKISQKKTRTARPCARSGPRPIKVHGVAEERVQRRRIFVSGLVCISANYCTACNIHRTRFSGRCMSISRRTNSRGRIFLSRKGRRCSLCPALVRLSLLFRQDCDVAFPRAPYRPHCAFFCLCDGRGQDKALQVDCICPRVGARYACDDTSLL